MMFVDTHAHLYSKEFDADRPLMIARAVQSGVTRFFLPNIDSSSIEGMNALADDYPGQCFPMMGLHPCSVKENYLEELTVAEQWLKKGKFYAVGEIGIDLYWDKTYFPQQQDAFRKQLVLALQHQLPVVIHCRDSFEQTIEIVRELNTPQLKGIFHCFSGTIAQANQVIDLGGFKLGIGGVVTFKNGGLDNVLPSLGLEHLVLETDAPYLAPVPHRGKRNESSYIPLVAARIAEIKQVSVEEVAKQTTANAIEIFGV